MAKRWSYCLSLLLLLAAGAHDGFCRRPVLRVPREAPTTGRYMVVLKEKTSVAEMQQVLTRILRMSDDSKVYGYVEKVAKAFTVKLSSYSLELVKNTCCLLQSCNDITPSVVCDILKINMKALHNIKF